MGKAAAWLKVREAWFRLNPPDSSGGYLCGICARWVPAKEVELDHILPRGSRPKSFADLDNLQPSHSLCNRMKGSRHLKPAVTKSEYELRRLLDL